MLPHLVGQAGSNMVPFPSYPHQGTTYPTARWAVAGEVCEQGDMLGLYVYKGTMRKKGIADVNCIWNVCVCFIVGCKTGYGRSGHGTGHGARMDE